MEKMDVKERHKRYLKYLGMDEDEYRELFKELGVNIEDPYPGILLDFDFSKQKEIILDLNTVRNMGMIIDPIFLLELMVNDIIPEFIFRPAKKGEISDRKKIPHQTRGYIHWIKYINERDILHYEKS